MSNKTNKEWEELFEKAWVTLRKQTEAGSMFTGHIYFKNRVEEMIELEKSKALSSERQRLKEEIEKIENPYPESVFPEIDSKDWKIITNVIKKYLKFPIDRISGILYRRGYNVARSDILKLLEEII